MKSHKISGLQIKQSQLTRRPLIQSLCLGGENKDHDVVHPPPFPMDKVKLQLNLATPYKI